MKSPKKSKSYKKFEETYNYKLLFYPSNYFAIFLFLQKIDAILSPLALMGPNMTNYISSYQDSIGIETTEKTTSSWPE